MADFAAVIRRAVDGLAENTPEMRVKVYEKARGAVRRQLESMKPRPPEDMLSRQLDKLEQAIADVENEHAEALPPVENGAEELEWQDEPTGETPSQDEPAEEDTGGEGAAEEVAAEEASVEEATVEEESAPDGAGQDEPLTEAVSEPEPAEDGEVAGPRSEPWDEPVEPPVVAEVVEDGDEEQSSTGIVPDDRQIGMWQEPLPEEASETVEDEAETVYAEASEPEAEAGTEPVDDAGRAPWEIAHEAAQDGPVADEAWDEPEPLAVDAPAQDGFARDESRREGEPESAVAVDYDPLLDSLNEARPQGETVSAHFETETLTAAPSLDTAWNDQAREEAPSLDWSAAPEPVTAGPAAAEAAKADDARVDDRDEPLRPPPMPPALDLLDWDESMFDPGPGLKSAASTETPAAARESKAEPVIGEPGAAGPAAPKDGWSDFGDLLASTPKPEPEKEAAGDMIASASLGGATASAPISYRTEPKRRNIKGLVIGVVLVALMGGAGYAGWLYRDSLSELAGNLMKTGPATPETAQTPAAGENAASPGENTANAPATTGNQTASNDGAQPAINKFTQRLLADGGEEDAGPALAAGETPAGEGKSVAEQNIASNATPPVAASGEPPQPQAQQQPAATPEAQPAQQQPVVAGQGGKMFLYEERIGQSVPTAIAGNAVWSVQEEAGDNGKPEPVVQAQINVPERGLSALITFKRNSDASLPASHLVEIVFSLPANFEGGAIESVQRIAMKTTEQDRGNPLIAVPAKITDDFHMIALNDFPEARATNLELLRSRDWIDIPVTYRNGRRALLTLEKGQAGTDAFNKAIQAWNALGTTGEP